MRRALLVCAAITFAIACTDNITEPTPDRPLATAGTAKAGTVAFATTTTEDGLSISTDKDDYQPGDTVHLTGSGWPADDVLDIKLDDEPATHAPHTWTVDVGADGTFHDSTYVVDVGDLGVTFTLTATSRQPEGRSLTVVFTDNENNISMPAVSPSAFSPTQASSSGIKDKATFTVDNGSGTANNVSIRIREGALLTGTLVKTLGPENYSSNQDKLIDWDGTNASLAAVNDGIYTARLVTVSGVTPTEHNIDVPPRRKTIVVDNTNPLVGVSVVANGTTGSAMTITGTASDATAGLEKVEVTVRRASDNAVLVTGLVTNTGTNFSAWTFSYTPTEASAQKVNAKATDNAGNNTASSDQTFTVIPPGPNHLAFTTAALTGVVGQCLGPITVQTQNASNVATNVTSTTIVSLGTDATGAFYGNADAACATPLSPAELTIAVGQHSASFRYRTTARGDGTHELIASATGLTSASQNQTINKATPAFSNLSSPTITFGDTPTFLAGEIGSGSLFPTGNVSITLNAVTQGASIGSDGKFSSSFATGALGVTSSPYTITYSYAGDDNFEAVSPDGTGTLTVNPRPITVKANNAGLIYYGDPLPTFGYTLTGSFVDSDEAAFAATLSYELSGTANSDGHRNVGNYSITPSWTYINPNYTITLASPGTGTLTIDPRPVTVTANNAGPVNYGDDLPVFGYTLTGNFVASDETAFAATLTYGLSGATNTDGFRNAGLYTITPGWTYVNGNYVITPGNGTLTISKRPITIKANNAGPIFYADPLPAFSWAILTGNFIATDETAFGSVVTFQLSSAVTPLPVGTHTITPVWTVTGSWTTEKEGNYVITPQTGSITVQPWTLSGFYQPVDMAAGGMVWNTVKGGSTVPLKFEVFRGTIELKDLAVVQPLFTKEVACVGNVADAIELTATGGTVLRFDTSGDQFIYNWQTPKKPGYCYQVTMKTADGTPLVAFFKLK